MIPHVPLIKRKVYCFLGTLFRLYIIARAYYGVNKFIKFKSFRKKALNIIRFVIFRE